MKNIFIALLLTGLTFGVISCGESSQASQKEDVKETGDTMEKIDNTLTSDQKKEGWKLLFDGKSMDGWHTFHMDKASPRWQAKDGKLVYTPSDNKKDGGDLLTDGQYENFHLKLDWKISDCGNSGIIFLAQEEGQEKTYHTGPEMQILDNTCHSDAKYPTHRAGSLYDLIQAQPETVKPAGEWNLAEIILDKGHLIFKLNGTQVVETNMFTEKWDEMVANSKFKQWPGFGTFKKGHIALQDHGDEVEFKNIMIKEL